jgi:hypothetical protein
MDQTVFSETHNSRYSVPAARQVHDIVVAHLKRVVFFPPIRHAMRLESFERSLRDRAPFLEPFAHALARAQQANAIALAQVAEDGHEGFIRGGVHGWMRENLNSLNTKLADFFIVCVLLLTRIPNQQFLLIGISQSTFFSQSTIFVDSDFPINIWDCGIYVCEEGHEVAIYTSPVPVV